MKEIYRTSNMGEIALLKSVFQSEDIPITTLDEMTSQMFGGMFGICRIMLLNDNDYEDACALLAEMELEPSP